MTTQQIENSFKEIRESIAEIQLYVLDILKEKNPTAYSKYVEELNQVSAQE